MEEKQDYSFRIETGEDYKSRNLIYEEPGYKLVVYVEMSGVKQFDWIALNTEFLKWTVPGDILIPEEKKREILFRLDVWCKKKRVRIKIDAPLDMNKMFSDYTKKGYKVEKLAGDLTKVSFSRRSAWLWNTVQIIVAVLIMGVIVIILSAIFSGKTGSGLKK